MAVSLAISEIFSVKNALTFKPGFMGSFKVIDNGAVRLTIYDFLLVPIVTIALSCIIFELFDVK